MHPGFARPASITAILTVASFVGLVAAGQTFVVLIGGIDLSVPWVLNGAAILLVTSSLGQDSRSLYALFLTLGMGAAAGSGQRLRHRLPRGSGGGDDPRHGRHHGRADAGPQRRHDLRGLRLLRAAGRPGRGARRPCFGVPAAVILWVGVIALVSFILSLTTFGRKTYAIGNNPLASYLAGVNVRLVTMLLYVLSGFFAALAGVLLVGFGGQASLGMGTPYLFQSIAAVVIGGVYMLGGRGHYLGAAAGAVTLVALVSVLLAMNMPDYGRNIIYGIVILVLLLLYGREEKEE